MIEGALAKYYTAEGDKANCLLCPVGCVISEGNTGFCSIRKNRGGKLYAEYYGKITSIALDPIEKKPLYRFERGSTILSIGGYSCNLRCPFCQNHSISMGKPAVETLMPEKAAEIALSLVPKGNIGIAYTYNEPFINYEYMLDTAKLVHEAGLKNVIITNGYVNPQPLTEILPYIDAMNIDLKAFNSNFYKMLKGGIGPVKETIINSAKQCHIEITTLIIPNENDNPVEIEEMARWIAAISPQIPLHLTRFFPNYKMLDKNPTNVESMKKLADIAEKYLDFVYLGNV